MPLSLTCWKNDEEAETMKRFLALLLACLMVFGAAAAEDYTTAEKLYKQLWAGSGFSGTLSLEVDSQSLTTVQPVTADVDYIYVRATDTETDAHRVDVKLVNGENAISAAYAQLKDGKLSFQADVLSPDWFVLNADTRSEAAGEAVEQALSRTGMPSLASTLALGAYALHGNDELAQALESYRTRIDVWIEGYRQDAVLSKLDDVTTVMQVHYVLTPAAIKAQVKQLVVDLLNDDQVLPLLAQALGEETAGLYLNPALQSWYFEAVDSLPFPGDLTLSRTLAMTGETLELHLSLPLYDAQTGVVTLSYDRVHGTGDLPEENTIRMETNEQLLTLKYQEYSSMTGVRVMQGTLAVEPAQNFVVEDSEQAVAVAFTLKLGQSESRDAEDRDVYACDFALTLAPAEGSATAFDETEIHFSARFTSRQLKSAATELAAQLNIASGETSVKLSFEGASRKKWDPEAIPQGVEISSFDQPAIAELLPGALLRTMAVLQPFLAQGGE